MSSAAPSPFDHVRAPGHVVLITAPGCPHCARAVAELQRLARACPLLSLDIVDLAASADLATRHAVRSVPATIVDDDVCIEGAITAESVALLLAARGEPSYAAACLRALLECNRVGDAVRRLGNGCPCAAIVPLLAAPEMSLRMGALLAVQQAHEQAAFDVAMMTAELVVLLSDPRAAIRGDIADLLGIVGGSGAVEPLRALVSNDEDQDVREVAGEALERIEQRGERCS